MKIFPELWSSGNWKQIAYIVADKGYDFLAVRCLIKKAGKIPVIPRRKNALIPGVRAEHKELLSPPVVNCPTPSTEI